MKILEGIPDKLINGEIARYIIPQNDDFDLLWHQNYAHVTQLRLSGY